MLNGIGRARRFMAGLHAYRAHPAKRDAPDMPVIWREGSSCLRDYGAGVADAPVVLIIPSLINRFDILDLDFAPSFLRDMAAAGFRPLVMDWNEPGEAETSFTLDDYVMRLSRALLHLLPLAPSSRLHVMGYCMGGLLALALTQLCQPAVASLSLLATPWDFHQPDATQGQALSQFVAEHGNGWRSYGQMPVELLQYLFMLRQPFQALEKFSRFAALDPRSIEARRFVLLEDWLNDGVPLPAKVADQCLIDWYGHNSPARARWRVGDTVIDPRLIKVPAYIVVPQRDLIVPPESARPLAAMIANATLAEPDVGHIGIMASRSAARQVWQPLYGWLKSQSGVNPSAV